MKIPKIDYKREKRLKNRLLKEADRLWHEKGAKEWGNTCFFIGSGKEAKQHTSEVKFGHHIKPKGLYPHLRHDLDNYLNVCWPCHYKLEKVDKSMIMDVVSRRGKGWYNRLEKKANNKPAGTFQTIKWYEGQIELLKNL